MNSYKIAGIDVHKKMLAVVQVDIASGGNFQFQRHWFGTTPHQLQALRQHLQQAGVQEVVMESTAQYWKPVWRELEGHFQLHLAQAQSNAAPRGRKRDFSDAERLVRRLVAGELRLSFVPDPTQRLWRMLTRGRQQLTRARVRLSNELEAFLEDARIKLSSLVSDVLGVSSQRMLGALVEGQNDPQVLAELADPHLKASAEQLQEVFSTAATLDSLQREVLGLFLERAELLERQIVQFQKKIATALEPFQEAVLRLAEVPGIGVDAAHQTIAELGPAAATFDSAPQLASWVGCCPGRQESAQKSASDRSPKGNRSMRRLLGHMANSAVKTEGSIFQILYRRLATKLGHAKAMWAVAHKLCRIIWHVLHQRVRYQERGQQPTPQAIQRRIRRLTSQFRKLGYQVQLTPLAAATS